MKKLAFVFFIPLLISVTPVQADPISAVREKVGDAFGWLQAQVSPSKPKADNLLAEFNRELLDAIARNCDDNSGVFRSHIANEATVIPGELRPDFFDYGDMLFLCKLPAEGEGDKWVLKGELKSRQVAASVVDLDFKLQFRGGEGKKALTGKVTIDFAEIQKGE